jgi:oligopeptide/dipeptide ABC transporter ATP-binding protein
MSALLEIKRLGLNLTAEGTARTVIREVDLTIEVGQALGLVGESGSGKSMTARSVLRLLPDGARLTGEILVDGTSVIDLDAAGLRRFRATQVAMIFQDPRAHINPVRTVGDFLIEGLTTVRGVHAREAERRLTGILKEVGITDASRRMRQRPHELSGGLLQRVMIAAALAAEPRLLLADEPTTALDVTTQEEVMAIIDEARRDRGLALLFITHDLELAAAVCDRIAVMYAGTVVEDLPAATLRDASAHPYTRALLASRPGLGSDTGRLQAIEGRPLAAFEVTSGCAFAARCPTARSRCVSDHPTLRPTGQGTAACHFPLTPKDPAHA